jgi:amino acid efflux transporter
MARIIYAAARDGSFPSVLANVDRRTGVPNRAMLALLLMTLASLSIFYLLSIDIQSGFLGTSGAAILTYVIGSAAGIRLLKERGARRLLPWASLLVSAAILPFIGVPLAIGMAIAFTGLAYTWIKTGKKA